MNTFSASVGWSAAALLLLGAGVGCFSPGARGTPQGAPAPEAVPSAVAPVVFQGVAIVDVRTGQLSPDRTVIVAGRRIRAIGPVRTVRVPAGAQVVDARGKYLIPGLWNMHVHQAHWSCNWNVSYPLLIANGVTGVREAYTPQLDSMLRLRREIAAGIRVGPRQIVAGPALIVSSNPSQRPDCGDTSRHRIQGQAALRTPVEARHVVDSLKAAGADFIKTRMSGRAEPPELTSVPLERALETEREIYFAAAAEARRVGIRFEGHLPWGMVSPITAADSGQRLIDHEFGIGYCWQDAAMNDSVKRIYTTLIGDTVSPAACRRLATHLRQRNTWLVPTLGGGCRESAADSTQWGRPTACLDSNWTARIGHDIWQLASRADVPFLTGTDGNTASYFGPAVHTTMAALVWVGLTPLQALQSATLNPALAYNATDSLGTVERGKLADLVLLDGNPLADISNTTKIRAVVANGRYFDRAALDSLRAQARHASR